MICPFSNNIANHGVSKGKKKGERKKMAASAASKGESEGGWEGNWGPWGWEMPNGEGCCTFRDKDSIVNNFLTVKKKQQYYEQPYKLQCLIKVIFKTLKKVNILWSV